MGTAEMAELRAKERVALLEWWDGAKAQQLDDADRVAARAAVERKTIFIFYSFLDT